MIQLFNPKNIRARTAELRASLAPAQPLSKITDLYIAAVVEVLDQSDFGCQNDNVYRLVGAILGEELPPRAKKADDKNKSHVLGSVIYTAEDNEFLLVRKIDSDGDANGSIRADGKESGSMYVHPYDNWRAATEEEVETFLLEAGLIEAPVAEAA